VEDSGARSRPPPLYAAIAFEDGPSGFFLEQRLPDISSRPANFGKRRPELERNLQYSGAAVARRSAHGPDSCSLALLIEEVYLARACDNHDQWLVGFDASSWPWM